LPVNGDTITVNGTVLTKAASLGATSFSTIAQLNTLIDAISGVTSSINGDYIEVTAETPGVAGNIIGLVLGGLNTGNLLVSAPTLLNGSAINSNKFVEVEIDALDALTGYVTFDVTVGVSTLAVGPITTNVTAVTLANIIDEIKIVAANPVFASVEDLVFSVNGDEISSADPIASMVFNVESVLPYSASAQASLSILQFTGGEVVTYDSSSLVNTLINTIVLSGGSNGSVTAGNVATALDVFADKDIAEINFLFGEAFDLELSQRIVDEKLFEIANSRRDIVATISAPIGIAKMTSNLLKKNAVIAKFDHSSYPSSSFCVFDQSPVYTYNKYADTYVWIPAAGHIAGLCANADLVSDPWFSPAGFNRGQLKGVTKVAFNPTKSERDDLYKKRINSIVSLPGEGIVLFGDKTALSKPSAFDRINVRRLFNVIQRSIATAAKYQLFELNDEFTRASFKNVIEPFLRDVQGRRGITEFRVVCDEFNNTGEVIDRNEFIGDIYVKPTRSINFIKLNFIATRTGVDFKEIVGA
jgi:hypothetical protein